MTEFPTPAEDRRLGHEARIALDVERMREANAKRADRRLKRSERGRDLRKRKTSQAVEDRLRDQGAE